MIGDLFTEKVFLGSRSLSDLHEKYGGKNGTSGGVTIVGGSELFHGAPILALKGASRLVSMVYFSSPSSDKKIADLMKTKLTNFIWVPYKDVQEYVSKSEAVLIGPGMMRSHVNQHNFVCDERGQETAKQCRSLFKEFPSKRWVVDGGALQVVSVDEIPKGSVITPNKKEFLMLFGQTLEAEMEKRADQIEKLAAKTGLVILTKDEVSIVSDGKQTLRIEGGNEGLVKGGVGDLISGILLGFWAKDDGVLAAAAASYLVKKAAEDLEEERGLMFNADDVADRVPVIYGKIIKKLKS